MALGARRLPPSRPGHAPHDGPPLETIHGGRHGPPRHGGTVSWFEFSRCITAGSRVDPRSDGERFQLRAGGQDVRRFRALASSCHSLDPGRSGEGAARGVPERLSSCPPARSSSLHPRSSSAKNGALRPRAAKNAPRSNTSPAGWPGLSRHPDADTPSTASPWYGGWTGRFPAPDQASPSNGGTDPKAARTCDTLAWMLVPRHATRG